MKYFIVVFCAMFAIAILNCILFYNNVPLLETDWEIHLGTKKIGEIAYIEFPVKNLGGKKLEIFDIKTDCSCSSLEILTPKGMEPVSKVFVPPKTTIKLAMRIAVRGGALQKKTYRIFFSTNDTKCQQASIFFIIDEIRHFQITPNEVFFGETPLGKQVSQDIFVDNIGMGNYKLDKIEIKDNFNFSIKNFPLADIRPEFIPSDTRMAKIKVFFIGKNPGVYKTDLELYFSNETETVKDIVPIRCEILENVSITPSDLTLPRNSLKGPVYSARISLKIAGEGALVPNLKTVPNGISIKPLKDQGGKILFFDITVDRPIVPLGTYIIDFCFSDSKSTETKKYPIHIME